MLDQIILNIRTFPFGLVYISMAIMILAIAKIAKDLFTPYKINVELTQKDNPALGLSLTGYYIAVLILFIGIVYHPDELDMQKELALGFLIKDILLTLFYSILGILFLNLSHFLTDKIILHKFSTKKEIIEDRNSGTGAVEFGTYVASGLIIAGALNGTSPGAWWFGIITATVFFLISQVLLMLFTAFYQAIIKYDLHEEIEKDNVSAGVAFGGNIIALGIIIFNSIVGDFPGWDIAITNLLTWSVAGFIIILVFRYIIDLLFIPNATIAEEIERDQNINAAYIESAILIGISAVISFVL